MYSKTNSTVFLKKTKNKIQKTCDFIVWQDIKNSPTSVFSKITDNTAMISSLSFGSFLLLIIIISLLMSFYMKVSWWSFILFA